MSIDLYPDIQAARQANGPADVAEGSIFGMGLHTKSLHADPLTKLVKLRDNELLHTRPAELCLAAYCRKEWDNWVSECASEAFQPRPGVPSKALLVEGFNRVLEACGISAVGASYRCFSEVLRRIGPGDAINLKLVGGITEPVFEYNSAARLALEPLTAYNSASQYVNPAVLCFDGHIEKVASLHKVLTWAAESKTPLLIVASGFGGDVIKTVSANTSAGKFSVLLLRPRHQEETSHFAISDLASASAAHIADQLPDSFPVESCGELKLAKITPDWLIADCDATLLDQLGRRIDADMADLTPAARVIALKRRNAVIGGRLDVNIPDFQIPGASHTADELSVILSLWSVFVKEKHIIAPDGLHSLPLNTFTKAVCYISETSKTLDGIGLYIKKTS